MSGLASSEPLRVLLVSPHEQRREEVSGALQAAGEHRCDWVSQSELALRHAQELAPHAVLVDDALDDTGAVALVKILAQALPGSAVLLLAASGAMSVAQAAMLAGARGCIYKPVKADDLICTLSQVLGFGVAAPQRTVREASDSPNASTVPSALTPALGEATIAAASVASSEGQHNVSSSPAPVAPVISPSADEAPRPFSSRASWLDRLRWSMAASQSRRIIRPSAVVLILLVLLAFIVPQLIFGLGDKNSAPSPVGTRDTLAIALSPAATTGLAYTAVPSTMETSMPSALPSASPVHSTSALTHGIVEPTRPTPIIVRLPPTATVRPGTGATPAPTLTAAPMFPVGSTARPGVNAPTSPQRTATSIAGLITVPVLVEPGRSQTVSGIVAFRWLPSGPLPAGAGYEVVWWNSDEPAASARGIAPPTVTNSLEANLDPLAGAGQFHGSQLYWTVLVVQTSPYVRLTSPDGSDLGEVYYSASSGLQGAPTPPKPR